ncbi:MAG TPA: protein-disulfide reductase DsbD domain-containing protein [Methylovirgula sp.]
MADGDAFASGWTTQAGGAGQVRLIARAGQDGSYDAAAEIKLAGQAITYWRDPGEAGVPPVFSFANSDNLAHADVLYPVPSRLDEAGLEALAYKGGTVFPIHIVAADKTKPVRLAMTLNYAICDKICIPAKTQISLQLPQSGESPYRDAIEAALARVPVRLSPSDVADKVSVAPMPGQAKPQWSVTWRGSAAALDLFAEAPEGWAFETTKTGENMFSLTALQAPEKTTHVDVRLTIAGAEKSYEFAAPLTMPAGAQAK